MLRAQIESEVRPSRLLGSSWVKYSLKLDLIAANSWIQVVLPPTGIVPMRTSDGFCGRSEEFEHLVAVFICDLARCLC